jgi:hypothetical protein
VADLYLPAATGTKQATATADAASATAVDVNGRAGLFFDERTGVPMRLVVNDGRLRIANGPALVAVAQDRFRNPRGDLFFRSQDEFELRFLSPEPTRAAVHGGADHALPRARPWTPSAADLQAVDGRYRSAELGSVLEIVPGTGGLVLRFERSPDRSLELTPVERDTYMRSMMIVRFRRDAGGRVVGFDYGNPLARDIGFTRLGDRSGATATAAAPPTGSAAAARAPDAPAPPLQGLVGEYEVAPGRTLTVTLEDGQLHGQPPGGAKRPLVHVSGTTFSAAGAPVTLTFTLGAEGRATAVVMRQNGNERTLPRVR